MRRRLVLAALDRNGRGSVGIIIVVTVVVSSRSGGGGSFNAGRRANRRRHDEFVEVHQIRGVDVAQASLAKLSDATGSGFFRRLLSGKSACQVPLAKDEWRVQLMVRGGVDRDKAGFDDDNSAS